MWSLKRKNFTALGSLSEQQRLAKGELVKSFSLKQNLASLSDVLTNFQAMLSISVAKNKGTDPYSGNRTGYWRVFLSIMGGQSHHCFVTMRFDTLFLTSIYRFRRWASGSERSPCVEWWMHLWLCGERVHCLSSDFKRIYDRNKLRVTKPEIPWSCLQFYTSNFYTLYVKIKLIDIFFNVWLVIIIIQRWKSHIFEYL